MRLFGASSFKLVSHFQDFIINLLPSGGAMRRDRKRQLPIPNLILNDVYLVFNGVEDRTKITSNLCLIRVAPILLYDEILEFVVVSIFEWSDDDLVSSANTMQRSEQQSLICGI
jgi:hypothetical protein